ncbi:rhomboid family intramembrane serine protease [Imtechella halotolerans]|uniref:Peptidase s54, rhomboid domain protein n=1 Tax=Imtechella halotolerans K1 TaxID=946077 RepID=I0WDY5_9FLAO|nr:rhomboid family intramembrane serine protease [Imtechella halotolerans]EID74601.1 peptidase s54, rhomboid domain protein [Imtechella halotolerans K1]WMQ62449.1 rhomboid family intramembrane serine protease [Imtechella halotolerans]
MKTKEIFVFYNGVIVYPFAFVLSIWIVYWLEIQFGVSWSHWGILPRTFEGLPGIFLAPFIHGSLEHLFNNSIPLLLLSAALFYFYRRVSWNVLLVGYIATGILTWIIGRESYHIGASGIIYMLTSFIFFKGIITRYYRLIALSLIIVFLYGGMMWYLFPIEEGISWEGHLSGFLVGMILAFNIKTPELKRVVYAWESPDFNENEDPFIKQFDENGNFISESEIRQQELENDSEIVNQAPKLNYTYVPERKE